MFNACIHSRRDTTSRPYRHGERLICLRPRVVFQAVEQNQAALITHSHEFSSRVERDVGHSRKGCGGCRPVGERSSGREVVLTVSVCSQRGGGCRVTQKRCAAGPGCQSGYISPNISNSLDSRRGKHSHRAQCDQYNASKEPDSPLSAGSCACWTPT